MDETKGFSQPRHEIIRPITHKGRTTSSSLRLSREPQEIFNSRHQDWSENRNLYRQEQTGEKKRFSLGGIDKPYDLTRTLPEPNPSKTTRSRNMPKRPFRARKRFYLTWSLALAWIPVFTLPIIRIIGTWEGSLYCFMSDIQKLRSLFHDIIPETQPDPSDYLCLVLWYAINLPKTNPYTLSFPWQGEKELRANHLFLVESTS